MEYTLMPSVFYSNITVLLVLFAHFVNCITSIFVIEYTQLEDTDRFSSKYKRIVLCP